MLAQERHKAGIYLRISDDREGRELGVGRQQEDCLSLAEREHYIVYDIYRDNDISASTRSRKIRPNYQRLLTDARTGAIDAIIAYTSNRLTRRPREHEDLIELAEQYGVKLYYVASPSFDLNSSAGRRIARMLAANDAGEAEDTAERVARAKLANAVKGQYMGGARAYGFEGPIKDKDGVLTNKGRINTAVIEPEKDIWCDLVARVIAGEREMDLVRDLNQRGITSPLGAKWRVGNLKQLLMRKRYVVFDATGHPTDCPCLANPEGNGTLVHHEVEHRAVWPGFITRNTHEQLLAAFKETGQPWAHGLARGRTYLLTGFTSCGRCGTVMYGKRRKVGDGYQRRYVCCGFDNHGARKGCGQVFRDAEALDAYVTEAVFAQFDSPEVARGLAPKEDEDRASELSQQLAGYKAHRRGLVAEYGRGEHSKPDYKLMLAAVDDAIEKTQAELAKLHASKVAGAIPANGLLREVWDSATLDWRRNVIRLLVDRVVVEPGLPGFHLWNGHRFNPDHVHIEWKPLGQDVLLSVAALFAGQRKTMRTVAASGSRQVIAPAGQARGNFGLAA